MHLSVDNSHEISNLINLQRTEICHMSQNVSPTGVVIGLKRLKFYRFELLVSFMLGHKEIVD